MKSIEPQHVGWSALRVWATFVAVVGAVLLAAWGAEAQTSPAFVQVNATAPQSSPTVVTLAYTAAQSAGNLNVVVVGWNDTTAHVQSVIDTKGNAYAVAVGPTVRTGLGTQTIFYAKNILAAGAGANTVTVTFDRAAFHPDIRIAEYRGIDTVNPFDGAVGATGTGTSSSSGALTTTNATDLLVGANLVEMFTTGPGTSFTQRVITTPDGDILEDRVVTTVGSYTAVAPVSSGAWVMQLAAFRGAGVVGPADLTITKTHSGAFAQGQVGATYALTVSNAAGGGPTAGTVTVTDTVPTGLTATALSGTGWTCTVASVSCTRSDVLAAAASYPPITLTVTVAATAPASVTNTASVSGGGDVTAGNNTASDPTNVTPVPANLTISKSHAGAFTQGQVEATYALTVSNTAGSGPTSGTVTVADTLPTGLTATALSGTGWTCTVASVSCTRSDVLAGGASYPAITVTVTVAATAPASVTNTASVSGGGDVTAGNNTASDPTTVTPMPADLTIAKTHAGAFSQGQTGAAYTLTVSNGVGSGPTSGTVTVTDTVPTGLTATALSGTGWTCTVASVSCTRSDVLAAGASYPAIALTVTVSATAPASVTNTASVSGGGDVTGGNNTTSDPTTITPVPADLTIIKTHAGAFSQGQTGAAYTLIASNSAGSGPTNGTVTVADTLPTGLTATALSGTGWTCTVASVSCTRSDVLAAGTSYPAITLTVTVSATAPASVTNTASVSGGGDITAGNNTASDPTAITPAPADLTITKTHAGAFSQGQTGAAYTLTVSNAAGSGPTSGTVTVTDTVPTGLTATALSGTGWTCTVASVSCTRSDVLAAGTSYPAITLTVTVSATAPASVTNTASVSGGGDVTAGNNTASDVTTITPVPADLAIAKTHAGAFSQGQTGAIYTLTVSNAAGGGPTNGTVTVTDTVPAGLTATALSGTGWTCTVASVSCTRSDVLAAGASYPAITLTVTVSATAPASVTNTASVSGGGDVTAGNNTASDVTTIAGASVTPAFVQVNAAAPQASLSVVTLAYTAAQTAGNLNVVVVGWNDTTAQVQSVTDTRGNAYVVAVGPTVRAGLGTQTIYYAPNIAAAGAGANTVTVRFNVAAAFPDIRIAEYTGVALVNPLDDAVGATGNSSSSDSGAITTTNATDLLVGANLVSTFTMGPGASFTQRVITTPDGDILEDRVVTTVGSYTASAPLSSGAWVMQLAAFRGAGVAGPPPDLTITKTHAGAFSQGQTGATYTLIASNTAGSGPTNGTVTVTDTLPSGLTATALSGAGWTCALPTVSCTRSDVLAAGAGYPAITLTVAVSAAAPASVVNTASVSGGGDVTAGNNTASDPTTIVPVPANLTITKTHTGGFSQGQIGATYALTVSNTAGSGLTSGTVTVADTLPTGLTATALSGTGWTCTVASVSCTRSDVLAAGASYPAITLTVTVAATAPASVTNTATVSGGGDVTAGNNTASDVTTITPVPADLTITKTHAGAFSQGQTGATYALTVSNAAGSGPTNGTVTAADTLPSGLTATALSGTGWTCTVASVSCTRSDVLAAGTSYPAITVTVTVAATAPASVTNTASVSGGGDVTAANNTASDPTTITPVPADLTITKTHAGAFSQGQTGATYTLIASNAAGSGPTNGTVTVADTLPSGLTATALSGTGWTCTVASVSCTRSDVLAAGTSYPAITLTVTVAPTAPASVTNTASVSGGGDVTAGNNTASDPTTITAVPADLTITKTHAGAFSQGQTGATYALTVSNVAGSGPTNGTVTVADTLPSGLTATALSGTGWTCTVASVSCTRSDVLAAGTSYPAITLTVTVAATAPASVTNTASVSGGGDVAAGNNTASDPTTITAVPADLTITKTHSGTFAQGQTGATYALTVSNAAGDGPTNGTVTVTDTVPSGLTATALSGSGWTCTVASVSCTRSDVLAAGASYPAITLTVTVATTAPASVTNTASVSGGGDVTVGNNTASDNTTITPMPADLTIIKTHAGAFSQGQTGATYTLTASNTAGSGPTNGTVTVADTLPTGLTATALSGTGWTCTVASVSCTRSDVLAAGASYPAITLTVTVSATAPASVTNTASVSGGGDVTAGNNSASDPTTITAVPANLTITKSHAGAFAQGQVGATYTLTVSNTAGSGPTSGTVTVADTVPTGLTATALSGTGWTCTVASVSCTRSDVLAAGASYPAITLTVTVSATAPASVTNTASVSGGGDVTAGNNSASDPTTITAVPANLTIIKSHAGAFAQGQVGATYTLTVSNTAGSGPTSGTVTVADTVPTGLTATALSGAGWTCTVASVSCTRSDVLAAGANYPAITLTVTVSATAPANVTNTASVSGGGDVTPGNNTASDPTTIGTDTEPPSATGTATATAVSGVEIDLSWGAATDNVGITGYRVERCQGVGCTVFTKLGTNVTDTTFADTSLSPNTSYSYIVRAQDAAGNLGDYSNVATALTLTTNPNLVAAYSFSEGAGTAISDASGHGNNGVITNATWTASGKFGNALLFNGSNALVTVADAASLRLTTGMTLEAWVNPTVLTSTWRDVIYKANDNYYLEATTTSGGVPAAGAMIGGSNLEAFDPVPLQVNTWSHIAETYDGTTLRLYVNGGQVASATRIGTITTSTNPLQIGGDTLYSQYFQGTIDEVRIYSVALTPAQIQLDMSTPVGGGGALPVVSLSSVNLTFGNQNTGTTSSPQTVTVNNVGGGSLTVGAIAITGSNAADFAQTNTCGATVPPGGSCAIQVTFTPGAAGARAATITIPNNAPGAPHTVALAGTGVGFAITPQTAVVVAGQTQQFAASGGSGSVVWSVDGVVGGAAATGTITTGGLYTAPALAGNHTVTGATTVPPASANSTVMVTNHAGIFTHHNDKARTGQNLSETVLTPANVNSSSFGKLFTYATDGISHASPLYAANVNIPGVGVRNVVYVSTEHDSVYAFDASGASATPLWHVSFINPAAGITTVPNMDTGECCDITVEIGITGTPVIDPATQTLYVVAKTKEGPSTYVHRLHALNIATGAEKFGGPVLIQASVPGTGAGSVNGTVPFDQLRENQRTGLLLHNGVVYFGFGSHGDFQPYHGWILGYNATTLQQTMVFCSTPNGEGGGIWLSGGGLTVDTAGNLFFATGDGTFDASSGGSDYGDSFLKLSTTGTVLDYFTPSNEGNLNSNNLDLDAGGMIVLPDQTGAHPHMIVSAGKSGTVYLVDRDTMTHFHATDQNPQTLVNIFPFGTPLPGNYSSPVYFNGTVYFAPVADVLQAFRFTNGLLSTAPTSTSPEAYAYPGGALAISANGSSNAILWAVQKNGASSGALRAYDANSLASELYNSNQAGTRDTLAVAAKFAIPLVVNGRVFVATEGTLTIYGLIP